MFKDEEDPKEISQPPSKEEELRKSKSEMKEDDTDFTFRDWADI